MTIDTFAAWAASAAAAALIVGAVRNYSDRAAWFLAVIILLGVVAASRARTQAVNDFLALLSGNRPASGTAPVGGSGPK